MANEAAALANRVKKNARHLSRWAKREQVSAYRIYDRDIPEFPYVIDRYANFLHLQIVETKRPLSDAEIAEHVQAIAHALDVERDNVALKVRRRQRGDSQYEALDMRSPFFLIEEAGLNFEVNLGRYLDTGLFLDHRTLRAQIRALSAGKRVLNLFAYTGSFTVYAAAGGATETLTVDLSQTYQAWSLRNLSHNGLDDDSRHKFVSADVLAWLDGAPASGQRFDLIVLDPPSFSNSKRMSGSFDVQRDHLSLLRATARLLAAGGELYFSNNRQGFRLSPEVSNWFTVEEITARTVPEDFKRRRPHQCWRLMS